MIDDPDEPDETGPDETGPEEAADPEEPEEPDEDVAPAPASGVGDAMHDTPELGI
jgi:hypothetical protein